MRTTFFYSFFAATAITANLLTQVLVTAMCPPPLEFWVALCAGTAVGLVVKYALDKQFIFQAHHLTNAPDIGKSFLLYASSGLLTTSIFWGLQIGFHHLFPSWPTAKYLGGALGLTIGYLWKYQLDKRYAFA